MVNNAPSVYKSPSVYNSAGGGVLPPNPGYIEIGGYNFPITRIGNKFWLAQNLDFYDSDFVLNAAQIDGDKPQINYFDNDENLYGKNGLKLGALYNYKAVELIVQKNILPSGWRVPNESDFLDLQNQLQNSSLNSDNLYNDPQPNYSIWKPRNNVVGFSAIPSGLFNNNYLFKSDYLFMWTQTKSDEQSNVIYRLSYEQDINVFGPSNAFIDRQYSVRLCADVV